MLQKTMAIAWKDTILRFSSLSELLFFLVLPLTFTVLLSGGVGGGSAAVSDTRLPLLVVDADGSQLAADLLAALQESDTVRPVVETAAAAEATFAAGDTPALLTIPAGFGAAVTAGETAVLDLRRQPENNNAAIADRAVQTAVGAISRPLTAAQNSLQEAIRQQPFASAAEADAYFQQSATLAAEMLAENPARVRFTQPDAALTSANSWDQAAHQSAGQLITWVFIPLLGTSALLAFERRYGTLRRLLVTPTKKATYLLGTITGQFAAAMVQMGLLVGFGILVMKVNWGQSPAGLALMLITFGLASVSFGVMLGAFVRTEGQANNLSIMLGMSMALLGGCWFPLELFPPAVQTAVHILPTTWAMQGLVDLVMGGGGLAEVLPEAAILSGYALLFFVIGTLRFRYE